MVGAALLDDCPLVDGTLLIDGPELGVALGAGVGSERTFLMEMKTMKKNNQVTSENPHVNGRQVVSCWSI